MNDAPEPEEGLGRLSALEYERLLRLRAEWELAEMRARMAKSAFEEFARQAARARGINDAFDIDWDRGLVRPATPPKQK